MSSTPDRKHPDLSVPEAGPVRAVLCSSAADLDSVVSAAAVAKLLNHTDPDPYVSAALIPISRSQLDLRREVLRLFREAGMSPGMIFCLDDPPVTRILADPLTRFVLVDRNQPDRILDIPADRVELIIDHHRDEGYFPQAERIIRPAGSTASIVADLYRLRAPALMNYQTALLLAGAVLLDTVCLSDEAGRTTDTDRQAAARLLGITGADMHKLYEMLKTEKFNSDGIPPSELLIKDYKEFESGTRRIGISSVPAGVSDLSEKSQKLDTLLMQLLRQRGLTLLAVMSAFYQGSQFTRQLSLTAERPDLAQDAAEFLHHRGAELTRLFTSGNTVCYDQKNTGYSRKIIQPLLSEFFCSLEED